MTVHAASLAAGQQTEALVEEGGARPVPFARTMAARASAAPTPIEVGEDKLTIAVTVRFELLQ